MRFFTSEEIKNKRIPSPESFKHSLAALRNSFTKAYDNKPLMHSISFGGAVVIGSVARGSDVFPTSDIDILAFYDDTEASLPELVTYLENISAYWKRDTAACVRLNIPINVYSILSSKLVTGRTRKNKQFLGHAMRCVEGLFEHTGEDALLCGDKSSIRTIFDLAPALTKEKALVYIEDKLEKLLDAYASKDSLSEERLVKALADSVNGPFHGARQMFDVLGLKYVDTKQGVIDACADYGFSKERNHLRSINELTKKYNQDILSYMAGGSQTPFIQQDRLLKNALFCLESMQESLRHFKTA